MIISYKIPILRDMYSSGLRQSWRRNGVGLITLYKGMQARCQAKHTIRSAIGVMNV